MNAGRRPSLLDRLVHRSHILLLLEGERSRFRRSLEQQAQALAAP